MQLGVVDRVLSTSVQAQSAQKCIWELWVLVALGLGRLCICILWGRREKLSGHRSLVDTVASRTPTPGRAGRRQPESQAASAPQRGRRQGWGHQAPGEPGREGSREGEGAEIHKEDLLGRSDAQRRLMKQIPRWVSEQLPKSLFAFKFPQGGGRLV